MTYQPDLILLDLDGVAFDFVSSIRRHIVNKHHRDADELPDAERWAFYEDWGYTRDEFLALMHEAATERTLWVDAPPFADATLGWMALYEYCRVVAITHRAPGGDVALGTELTLAWMNRNGLKVDVLDVVSERSLKVDSALEAIKYYKPRSTYGIEDYVPNAEAWAEIPEVRSYILDRPYNHDIESDLPRVASLDNFAKHVMKVGPRGKERMWLPRSDWNSE